MARVSRAPYLFPEGSVLGVNNAVLNARARVHRVDNYAGPLSIKTVISGQVGWHVGGRELIVDSSSFLVLAEGERYSMNINAARPMESCCVFFAPGFVESAARDWTAPLDTALDEPDAPAPKLPYLSALHSDAGRTMIHRVRSLAPRCRGSLAPSGFEEDFLILASELLQLYHQIRAEAARVPAARESTRQELYRRLLIGRDYMHSHAQSPVSLTDVAKTACLSPFHFHRGFSNAFRQTPHAYLTDLRLDQARRLIESGSPVLDACLEVGFSSPSSFSRLFRSRFGQPPLEVRKFARLDKKSAAVSATLAP